MFYFALDLGFCSTRPRDSSEVNHKKMSPVWPLSLTFFLSCLPFPVEGKMAHGQQVEGQEIGKQNNGKSTTSEQSKESKTYKVRHGNKLLEIKTTNNEEGGEYGEDYQVPAPCGKERLQKKNGIKWEKLGLS